MVKTKEIREREREMRTRAGRDGCEIEFRNWRERKFQQNKKALGDFRLIVAS